MTGLSIRTLGKQPWDFGTLYSTSHLDSDGLKCRGRLFVFNDEREFVEREFGGLERVIQFKEEQSPGAFELNAVAKTPIGFVSAQDITEEEEKCFNAGNCFMVKGHPYQSLVTLHRIEQAMPKSDKYELIPLKKYFGTNDTIVTELILDSPVCYSLNYGYSLFTFREYYSNLTARDGRVTWCDEPKGYNDLLREARKSEEGKKKLKDFIAKHKDGGEDWFGRNAQRFILYERREDLLSESIKAVKVEEVLPFAEEALDALYSDLEATGKKLRMSHHVDPRPANVFFRGMNNGRFQFTLIDQYHCGWAEKSHHDGKYGGLPILSL